VVSFHDSPLVSGSDRVLRLKTGPLVWARHRADAVFSHREYGHRERDIPTDSAVGLLPDPKS